MARPIDGYCELCSESGIPLFLTMGTEDGDVLILCEPCVEQSESWVVCRLEGVE